MAVCNPWDKPAQQHMALRHQEDSVHPVVLVHQQRHQTSLVQHHQQRQNPQWGNLQNLLKPIQTPCLTEDN